MTAVDRRIAPTEVIGVYRFVSTTNSNKPAGPPAPAGDDIGPNVCSSIGSPVAAEATAAATSAAVGDVDDRKVRWPTNFWGSSIKRMCRQKREGCARVPCERWHVEWLARRCRS